MAHRKLSDTAPDKEGQEFHARIAEQLDQIA